MRDLTIEEKDNMYMCLGMRRCLIETGYHYLSAKDVEKVYHKDILGKPIKPKALSREQRDLIDMLENFQKMIYDNKIKIDD